MTGLLDRVLGLIDAFQPADGPPPRQLWPFARWALSGAERAIGFGLIVTFVAGCSELAGAALTGWIIDQATASPSGVSFWAFWPMILAGLGFYLIVRPILFSADAGVSSILLGPHLFPLVMGRLNSHTTGHSLRFFQNDFAGRIAQKAMQTARALTDIVIEVSDIFLYGIAIFIGALVMMASVDLRLLAMFAVWGALYAVALRYFIPRVQIRAARRAEARAGVTGQVVDTVSNIATVKLFATDAVEDSATQTALRVFRQDSLHFGLMAASFRMVLMTLGGLLPLCSILGSLYLWTQGQASTGDIAMVAMVATRLSQVTNRMGFAAISVFTNLGEVADGIDTLCPPHEIRDKPDATDLPAVAGEVRFDAVRFAYDKGSMAALADVTLDIPAGQKIGLVGASGAGKSTLISLLLRLYDLRDGRISIDGYDIRDVTQDSLRRQIAVVRQEAATFNRSALENIRYGRPDATDEEVFAAAKKAEAHDFILGLRDHKGRTGYEARLGERGVKLSGGQLQRIALARAILKDAPILILDEATSALDSEVEVVI